MWSYPLLLSVIWGSWQAATLRASRFSPRPAGRSAQSSSHGVSLFAEDETADTDCPDLAAVTRLLKSHGCGDAAPIFARALLARAGSFAAATKASPDRLRRWGMDERVIDALSLAGDAIRAALRSELDQRPILADDAAVLQYLYAELANRSEEQLHLLFLNAQHRLISVHDHGHGTINRATVFPREIVREAIDLGAAHLIMAHNHPSGDPSPSSADIQVTRAVRDALRPVGVALLDHIIVTRSSNASMRALGYV
jgi:DNA repair protein RadC